MQWNRHGIYLGVVIALAVPLLLRLALHPGRFKTAEQAFDVVESLKPQANHIAMVAFDFSPSVRAENEAQSKVLVEHLFRKRIPIAFFTLIPLGEPFLSSVPNDVANALMKELPSERWEYGKDWINLGFRPGADLFLQGIGKSENLTEYLGQDAFGTKLESLPVFSGVKNLTHVSALAEMSGSYLIPNYIQFFQRSGYVPKMIHGPTSIIIPHAYIYLDSGQLQGLLEGISGAAWYAELLHRKYHGIGENSALVLNSSLGVAQLFILFLIMLGNILEWKRRRA